MVQVSNMSTIEDLNKESNNEKGGIVLRSQTSNLEIDGKNEKKVILNARRGITGILTDLLFGKSSKNLKKGSAGYLINRIQNILRLISVIFSLIIIIFLISSKINKNKKQLSDNYPIGSLGRSLKFDLMLDNMEESKNDSLDENINDNTLEKFHSEIIDDPDYWADEDDRDLWEDDDIEYYDMDIIDSEDIDIETNKNENNEHDLRKIIGERNKGLRSKGIQVSLPSSLTLYGRVNSKDSYINGIYNIMLDIKENKKYPKLHHGRAIYVKNGINNYEEINKNNIPTLYIIFDGKHEFWTINTNIDSNTKPLAFLPDHALIPIRHVGPYGAHPNSSWIFRNDSVIIKDRSVRIVENSSIDYPRIPVYITKATHNWHIKHHNQTQNKEFSHKYNQINKGNKIYIDPYKDK